MIKMKFLALYFAFKVATCSCADDEPFGFLNWNSEKEIEKTGKLNTEISESSGLQKTPDGKIWTHNDSGALPQLFQITEKGELLDVVDLEIPNRDWEDITADTSGHIFIGDFGNNLNKRKDLTIFKCNSDSIESIYFSYGDQQFEPDEPSFFDCEAFFWFEDSLYLFTKSWEKDEPLTKLYVLPDKAGSYEVLPKESLLLHEPVTAADINPSGTIFALLTYGKVLLFEVKNHQISLTNPLACIKTRRKQTEALTFLNDYELLISNEQGEVFHLQIPLTGRLNTELTLR